MSDSGRLRALHPFTPLVLTIGVVVLAFALPAPGGPAALYAVAIAVAAFTHPAAALHGAMISAPLWAFLLLLHVILPGGEGIAAAASQGARLGAVATASFLLLRSFNPSRFLDAVAERGWPFPAAYLVVATMQAAPRLRERSALILESQRARGLRVGGGPAARLRALRPLILPLLLSVVTETDDRALALEVRGLAGGAGAPARTPLAPVPATARDRLLWWGTVAMCAGTLAWRLLA